jgi:type IV pilus assembly protein PilO
MDLKSIDINDPKVKNVLLIIFIGIALAGAIYYFQVIPQQESLATAEVRLQKKQDELNEILTIKPQLEKLRKSVAELQIELDSLSTIFPDSANLPEFISDFTKQARRVGVSALNFKPLPDVTKQYYVEHSYSITLISSYHNFARLLEHLANLDLIINVGELNISANPGMDKEISEFNAYEMPDGYDDSIRSMLVKFKITTYSSIPTETE